MRPNKVRFAKFESLGYPTLTTICSGTLPELLKLQAAWMLKVTMGSRIQITFARNADELESAKSQAAKELDLMFDSMFDSDFGNNLTQGDQ